jgi:hypothetical protein
MRFRGAIIEKAHVFAGYFDGNVSRETFLLCQISSGERNAQRFLEERYSESALPAQYQAQNGRGTAS